jgi:hypothetical protein
MIAARAFRRVRAPLVAIVVPIILVGCGFTPKPPAAASLNIRQSDVPGDLQPCPSVPAYMHLYTPAGEAAARKGGAIEFSIVNYAADPVFCSGGAVTRPPLRIVQAFVIRFRDATSAAQVYRGNVIVGSTITGPYTKEGVATGYGANSAEFHSGPLAGNEFGLNWQKGAYIFGCEDGNLTDTENGKLADAVYKRTPSS